jgi:hypothetical protein
VSAIDWLLDSDPSIRWQVMRDLLRESPDVVAAERARVATEGWGARLLQLQAPDGQWGGGTYYPKWTSTINTLMLLRDLGVDPTHPAVRDAVELVRTKVVHDTPDQPFFVGETEVCVNGRVLVLGAYFDVPDSDPLGAWLLERQLDDGGWNCEAPPSIRSSFHSVICALDGLAEFERRRGASAEVTAARRRGENYLLDRRLFRKRSTDEIVDHKWTQFSFPTRWHYDVLWGLDYLRSVGAAPDERAAEAIELVESKRDAEGRWPLDHFHPGQAHFDLDEGEGRPSKWITLRALRVLDWYRASP